VQVIIRFIDGGEMPERTKRVYNPSKREEIAARRKREKTRRTLTWSGLAVLAVVLVVAAVLLIRNNTSAAAVGEEVAVGSADHVPQGTDPGPYPTDPPAGGKHYPSTYKAGFYHEADAESLPRRPEGYLVHNLEHGYVVYWYNCAADPSLDCDALKSAIQEVQDEVGMFKTIAFPWPSQAEPLVITSWGRILRLDSPDKAKMLQFYRANLNKAPEPFAE
jgi:hypothetical protein